MLFRSRRPREFGRELNLDLPWRMSKKWGDDPQSVERRRSSRHCRSGGKEAPPVKFQRRGGGSGEVGVGGGEKGTAVPFHPDPTLYRAKTA